MRTPGLLDRVRGEVLELLNGYLDDPAVQDGIATYIAEPALGARAGVLGAIALAQAHITAERAS
jgi:fructokinase